LGGHFLERTTVHVRDYILHAGVKLRKYALKKEKPDIFKLGGPVFHHALCYTKDVIKMILNASLLSALFSNYDLKI